MIMIPGLLRKLISLIAGFLGSSAVRLRYIRRRPPESYWCSRLAEFFRSHGMTAHTEYVLDDGCRIDVLAGPYACELDWADKWAECIGQALYYGAASKRSPVAVLIVRNTDMDERFIARCRAACSDTDVQVWLIHAGTQVLFRNGVWQKLDQ